MLLKQIFSILIISALSTVSLNAQYTQYTIDLSGRWVKFHVMREDSQDSKLILKSESTTGPNLMITKMVLVKEV